MTVERTLSIIKPDAVNKMIIGEIYSRFEKAGMRIVAAKMLRLSKERAESFYAEHSARPFFNDLVAFIYGGLCVVALLKSSALLHYSRVRIGEVSLVLIFRKFS